MKIQLDDNPLVINQLYSQGLSRSIQAVRPYNINECCTSIQFESDELKPKRITKQDQLKYLNEVLESPFKDPYVYFISSVPNDTKAKLLAAFVMQRAYKVHRKRVRNSKGYTDFENKDLPIWHTVNGSFQDKIRDNTRGMTKSPSMLIISNVHKDCTNVKIEKVRDLLEAHSSIPRIVVLSGINALEFANTKIYYPINYCTHITTGTKVFGI